jgi:hypothetical protein
MCTSVETVIGLGCCITRSAASPFTPRMNWICVLLYRQWYAAVSFGRPLLHSLRAWTECVCFCRESDMLLYHSVGRSSIHSAHELNVCTSAERVICCCPFNPRMYWMRVLRQRYWIKSSIFWDITLCSPLKINRSFGGTCRLRLRVEEWAEQETSVKVGGKLYLPPAFTECARHQKLIFFSYIGNCSAYWSSIRNH